MIGPGRHGADHGAVLAARPCSCGRSCGCRRRPASAAPRRSDCRGCICRDGAPSRARRCRCRRRRCRRPGCVICLPLKKSCAAAGAAGDEQRRRSRAAARATTDMRHAPNSLRMRATAASPLVSVLLASAGGILARAGAIEIMLNTIGVEIAGRRRLLGDQAVVLVVVAGVERVARAGDPELLDRRRLAGALGRRHRACRAPPACARFWVRPRGSSRRARPPRPSCLPRCAAPAP